MVIRNWDDRGIILNIAVISLIQPGHIRPIVTWSKTSPTVEVGIRTYVRVIFHSMSLTSNVVKLAGVFALVKVATYETFTRQLT